MESGRTKLCASEQWRTTMPKILEPGDPLYAVDPDTHTRSYARDHWKTKRLRSVNGDATWWCRYRMVEHYEGPEMQVEFMHGRKRVGASMESMSIEQQFEDFLEWYDYFEPGDDG